MLKDRVVQVLLCAVACAWVTPTIAQPEPEDVTIDFNYTGVFNGVEIKGTGTLVADPRTGLFEFRGVLTSFPPGYTPYIFNFSKYSISCINSAWAVDGPLSPNMLTVAGDGRYMSIAMVRTYDERDAEIGNITIAGLFTHTGRRSLNADVVISGYYDGPTELTGPAGYLLGMQVTPRVQEVVRALKGQGIEIPIPVEAGLVGETESALTARGTSIRSVHNRVYLVERPAVSPVPNAAIVRFFETTWDPTTGQDSGRGMAAVFRGDNRCRRSRFERE